MQRILNGLAVLVLPLNANAVLIGVDFEGVVTSIFGPGLGFTVGDPISGALYINDALAPPDTSPETNVGSYNNFGVGNSGFVTGFSSGALRSFDLAFVSDGAGLDQFVVNDNEFTPIDATFAQQNLLNIRAVVEADFLTGGGLVQNFQLLNVAGITGLMLTRIEVTASGAFMAPNGAAFAVHRLNVSPVAVPEPETALLLATGLLSLAFVRGRARRSDFGGRKPVGSGVSQL
jgi:hypothetical protein